MIRKHTIPLESGQGSYTIFNSPDFEFVDPTQHFAESFIVTNVSMMRDLILLKKPPIPLEFIENFIHKEALKDWFKKLKDINDTKIPDNLIALLTANTKKDQIKLLKNLSITPDQLIGFIFKAWTDYGFRFSQYTSEYYQNGLDKSKMPKLVEIKGDTVFKIGDTSLTDGQLKQAVDHRKVIVAKFFDNKTSWHCFFLTFDSLKGKETWKNGQPHYHYISDKFGIDRQKVVEQLKGRKYNLGNLPHIDLIGYNDNEE
ncbi:hypothetical protein [Limnovirga soli]|uniref:Uncharacterized protein n=1 Tax=Limnovirga soli TaxID=2656915 RepID=A0A8J8JV86_9BACT|nr:hypothetical protein [Limnovirga soli]NNV53961.1 hypothetical protein [Limnovirga soli]